MIKITIALKMLMLISWLLLPLATNAQVTTPTLESGLRFVSKDTTFSYRVNPVLQNQLIFTDTEAHSPEFLVKNRRTRFYVTGFVIDPRLTYKIQLRFESNNQNLYDAAFKFQVNPKLSIWFGQETLPAARSQLVSLKYLQFVDRSIVHSIFDLQKDLGLWAFYKTKLGASELRISSALSNGEGIFRGANTQGYSYTGRVDWLPLGTFIKGGDIKGSDVQREPLPKLALGVAYNFNDEANANRGQRGAVFPNELTTDISTLYLDGMFKYQGWSIMGEWIVRSTKDPILEAEIPVFDGHGYSIQGGYLLDNNMELALRLAVTEPNISIQDKVNSVEEYTFGLNKYIAQYSLKIQGDVSYRLSTGIEPSHSIQSRLQVTINF